MHIVTINGSPRKNGATAGILHTLEQELSAQGAAVDFLDISDLNIAPCKGCMSCYQTGVCCIKDDGDKITEQISRADGLIIGTPTYASNISGQLKILIDRGHFVIEQLLHGKHAVSVATGVNYGNRDACKVLDRLFLYSGACLSGKPSAMCRSAAKRPMKRQRRTSAKPQHISARISGKKECTLCRKRFIM